MKEFIDPPSCDVCKDKGDPQGTTGCYACHRTHPKHNGNSQTYEFTTEFSGSNYHVPKHLNRAERRKRAARERRKK